MSTKKDEVNRRIFLQKVLYHGAGSAVAVEGLLGVPFVESLFSTSIFDPLRNCLDSNALLADAVRGGASFLGVHKAMAASQPTDVWSVVTIKVVNHVATPLVFGLGKVNDDKSLNLGSGVTTMPSIGGEAKQHLEDGGVLKISDKERYAKLRLNRWFADILHFGTSDGEPLSTSNSYGLPDGATSVFPTTVALQAALHVQQGVPVNHSLKGFKVRPNKPDLAKYIQDQSLVVSPLGITCFMAGGQYDKAEGTTPVNIICDADGENPAVGSRTVNEFVQNISQSLSAGYIDTRKIEDNLIAKFDRLARGNSKLRSELIASREAFVKTLDKLKLAADIEQAARQTYDPRTANGQSGGEGGDKGAQTEFLGQCYYTARAISSLEGTPLRNFSLFLNMNDLDQKNLDTLTTNGNNSNSIKSLTYIEGMRQLAVGLNILAQPIAEGKKVLVQVLSEGGRSQTMGDQKISFAFVMGPGGTGMLEDNLMANMEAISTPGGAVVRNPGSKNVASVPWDGDYLREEDGTEAPDGALPNTGDIQMGIMQFIAEATQQTEKLQKGRGRYVRFKKA